MREELAEKICAEVGKEGFFFVVRWEVKVGSKSRVNGFF